MLRSLRPVLTGTLLICLLPLSSLWYLYPHRRSLLLAALLEEQRGSSTVGSRDDSEVLNDVHNSTLGFEKVFVINLPERTDKLDNFAVVSSLTGFTADVIDGVKGAEVKAKALPALEGLSTEKRERDNTVGCWRAHLNFAQTIVNQRLSSALVMEDDADWDISLKSQLSHFAQGSQFITANTNTTSTPSPPPHSPYGDDWDLLWLGHCGADILQSSPRRFLIENDPTVPPPHGRFNVASSPDMEAEGHDNHTRIVFRAQRGLCLYAYALSYRGARKLLRNQASMTKFAPIDIGIGDWCERDPDVKCLAPFPQLIDTHKPAGRLSRDSDIGDFSAEESRGKGFTWNIAKSVRLNVDVLLDGGGEAEVESQWPEEGELEGDVVVRAVEMEGGDTE